MTKTQLVTPPDAAVPSYPRDVPAQWQLYAWVWSPEWRGLDVHHKAVLSGLIRHWNNQRGGVVWPSQQRLVEITRQSKSTINRRLDELEDVGLITRLRYPGMINTRYQISIPLDELPYR